MAHNQEQAVPEHQRLINEGILAHARRLQGLVDNYFIGVDHNDNEGDFMGYVGQACEKKRLFICCDGTGQNAAGTIGPLTNVAKLARAVDRIGNDKYRIPRSVKVKPGKVPKGRFGNVRQIVYYSSGVGTRSALGTDRLYAAAFGKGVSANLLDAYCFIANNFNGFSLLDEIILVGFSRGAFTVRCLAQFINDVGLLRRSGLVFLQTMYNLWVTNSGRKPADGIPEHQWPESYRNMRKARWALGDFFVARQDKHPVKIKVLAEWDTVSATGRGNDSLSFVGNKVPANVENAFLAVSLHEKRKMFKPMLWGSEENRGTKTRIRQCVFAGCHSDVGGGNQDPALSTASFFWMIAQFKHKESRCHARFDHITTTFQYVTPLKMQRSWWSWKRSPIYLRLQSFTEGLVEESRTGWYAIPYWLFMTLWDGKRDSLWKLFLKEDNAKEHEGNQPIDLSVHITVRLLYENRYRDPAIVKRDTGLRCGLFKKYRPELHGTDEKRWKWVKRGSAPNRFLEEDEMGDDEKYLFRKLGQQARKIDLQQYIEETLEDRGRKCDWAKINNSMRWEIITKGCTYEETFISLLEDFLGRYSADDESEGTGDSDDAETEGTSDPDIAESEGSSDPDNAEPEGSSDSDESKGSDRIGILANRYLDNWYHEQRGGGFGDDHWAL